MSSRASAAKWILGYGALALVIVFASIAFDNEKTQRLGLIVPFFSGAANYELGRGWMYDASETERVRALPSREARENHRFPRSENLEPYDYTESGYVIVVLAARTLFFWQGDFKAVESLQITAHLLITLFIVAWLKRRSSQFLFFVLYGINPLILHIVTFPLYYFWQAVPSALLLLYLLDRDFRYRGLAWLVVAVLAFIFVVRPPTLLVSGFLLVLLTLRESRRVALAAAATALAGAILIGAFTGGPVSVVWHSAYIGIGAYPNPYVERLADESAYNAFRRETGVDLNSAVAMNYRDEAVWAEYAEFIKRAYLEIARESPLLLIRNAALNCFQSFSLGYITRSLVLSYLSSLIGFIFCAVLLLKRRFLFVLAISMACASYAPYVPPIPAYMYGSYILLVGALIDMLRDYPIFDRWFDLAPLRKSGAASA